MESVVSIENKETENMRMYYRLRLDQNKSKNDKKKGIFETYLDFVLACEKLFNLPEQEYEQQSKLLFDIGEKYLGKPPHGSNLAFGNQCSRKRLEDHCKSLERMDAGVIPNRKLLEDSYNYVFLKLDEKNKYYHRSASSK